MLPKTLPTLTSRTGGGRSPRGGPLASSASAARYAHGMPGKKAASAKPRPEPKPKAETVGTPEHLGSYRYRPYTGCGDPRRWQQRIRNR